MDHQLKINKSMLEKLKMYILIKESLTSHKPVAIAHASLQVYLQYKDTQNTKDWLEHSFKKVVCEVNDEDFEKAKQYPDYIVVTENTLNNAELAIGFMPRNDFDPFFKTLKLMR